MGNKIVFLENTSIKYLVTISRSYGQLMIQSVGINKDDRLSLLNYLKYRVETGSHGSVG